MFCRRPARQYVCSEVISSSNGSAMVPECASPFQKQYVIRLLVVTQLACVFLRQRPARNNQASRSARRFSEAAVGAFASPTPTKSQVKHQYGLSVLGRARDMIA